MDSLFQDYAKDHDVDENSVLQFLGTVIYSFPIPQENLKCPMWISN